MADLREVRCSTDREPGGNGRGFADHLLSTGFVYFIGGEEGTIKIGVSIAPVERLIAMQMGCPIKLSIFAKVEGRSFWRRSTTPALGSIARSALNPSTKGD